MNNRINDLDKGVVLAELGGYTDGKFCAIYGKNSALVMLGTYIVSGRNVDYPERFVFKPGRDNFFPYLKKNILEAKKSLAKVGISVVSVDESYNLDFLSAAEEAGADYVSYCAHSTMKIFLETGTSSALLLKKNFVNLEKLTKKILKRINVPVIFKIGAFDNPDIADAIEVLKLHGIQLLHININNSKPGSIGIRFLDNINKEDLFIIAGGGIKDVEGAKRLLKHGANAISIGNAAIKNPHICGNIQRQLRQESPY